jgi:hypothetical protein
MTTHIEMEYEDWAKEYQPQTVLELTGTPAVSGAYGDGTNEAGQMFETFGDEEQFVRNMAHASPGQVWTLLDNEDGGSPLIGDGFHYVNRLGYFITRTACPEDTTIIVTDDAYED